MGGMAAMDLEHDASAPAAGSRAPLTPPPPEFGEAPTARAAVGEPPPMHCPNGYPFQSDSADFDDMACDVCKNDFLLGEAILSCRLCDFDRCSPRCWH